MPIKKYLSVPYKDKDEVKNLGAMWDHEKRMWFIFDQMASSPFRRWLPDDRITIKAAQYSIMRGREVCWSCGRSTDVFGFYLSLCEELWEEDEECGPCWSIRHEATACFITFLGSGPAQQIITVSGGKYRNDFSKTTNNRYWMNHCQWCDAKLGDHYLFCEPGGPFLPTEYSEKATDMGSFNEPFEANGDLVLSTVSVIDDNCVRL